MSGIFANDPSSCSGASNPLLSLSKMTNNSNSLTSQEFHQFRQQQGPHQSRDVHFNSSNNFLKIDNRLEQDFNSFNSSSPQSYAFNSGIANPIQSPYADQFQQHAHMNTTLVHNNMATSYQHHPASYEAAAATASSQTSNWSNEFSKLSLYNNRAATPKSAVLGSSNQQFYGNSPIVTTDLLTQTTQQEDSRQREQFDSLFELIENELSDKLLLHNALLHQPAQQPLASQTAPGFDYDREKFAQTARLVANAMSSNKLQQSKSAASQDGSYSTAKKFQNSNFLKLMNQVSNKTIVINDKGDGFMENEIQTPSAV